MPQAVLFQDGHVGVYGEGGVATHSVAYAPHDPTLLGSNMIAVYTNRAAFAAVRADGRVVCWGRMGYGGTILPPKASHLDSGVVKVVASQNAFAALKDDKSVVAWGGGSEGETDEIARYLEDGVESLVACRDAFAVLKTDGLVVGWGWAQYGDPNCLFVRNAASVRGTGGLWGIGTSRIEVIMKDGRMVFLDEAYPPIPPVHTADPDPPAGPAAGPAAAQLLRLRL